MIIALLLIIVAVAVTYLAHVQRRTVEIQAVLINHLVDIVKKSPDGSEPQNGDKIHDIITKAHSLPS